MKYFKQFQKTVHSKLCPKCKSTILNMNESIEVNYYGLDYNCKSFTSYFKTLFAFFDFDLSLLKKEEVLNSYKQHRRFTKIENKINIKELDNSKNILLLSRDLIPTFQYIVDFNCDKCGFFKTVISYDYFSKDRIK